MPDYLISLGGQVYLPNMPEFLTVSAVRGRYEITDTPLVTGREYDQSRYVGREAAAMLVSRHPDMWRIENQ